MHRLDPFQRHVHRPIDRRERARQNADDMKRMRCVIRRADVAQAVRHHHRRTHRVPEALGHFAADHHFAVTRGGAAGGERDATILAKAIARVELGGGAHHAKASVTVAQRVRHDPLHGGMGRPSLHGRSLHAPRRRADAEHGTEQYLQRPTARTDNEVDAANGTGEALAHTRAHRFDAHQQRHRQRNRRHRERRGEQATAQRLERQTRNQHAGRPVRTRGIRRPRPRAPPY